MTPYIISEPYGVVLVLGPWNYPLQLALAPFVGAITAGNTVVLKPSELSPATSGLLANLIPKYLDQDCYHVFPGGAEEAQALLKLKFDYIFYTGSTTVGKLVYEAATKHLTPVTLELGGKCPTYIADDANLEVTAKRMMWGKMLNAGQTCIAPDYILTSATTRDRLVAVIADTLKSFYGDIDPINSPDFGRIVSNKHVARLEGLLSTTRGTVALGGQVDAAERYVAPTVVIDVSPDDPLMKEESQVKLLYLNPCNADDLPSVPHWRWDKHEASPQSKLALMITSGLSVLELPFGGVGHSGLGKYHGKASFDAFSHPKSVLRRSFTPVGEMLGKYVSIM
ncbi:ALDH3A2, partial [Cordylochernes scorpioides]